MTKKKRNIRFKPSDAVITVFCLLLLIASLFLFYKDITRVQTKRSEQPIATITFKYRTAQRKLNGRVIWDRLRQQSPVYNADTLRTAPQSEATIYLKDGNILTMNENTMVQIFYNETGAILVSDGGSIGLDTTGGSAGFTVITDSGSRIEAGTGTTLNARSSSGGLAVQVQNGTALIASADGTMRSASAGTELLVSSGGSISEPPLAVTSPLPDARILHFTGETGTADQDTSVPLLFSWKTAQPEPDAAVIIELSYDKNFSHIIAQHTEAPSGNAVIQCKAGTVYWRISPQNTQNVQDSAVYGKVRIMTASPPKPIQPAAGMQIAYRTQSPVIRFAWSGNDWVSSYELEVASDPEMADPVIKQRVSGTSASTAALTEGTWFWRVTPYYTVQGALPPEPSAPAPFTIYKSEAPAAPVPVTPGSGSVITRSAGSADRQESIRFSWKADPDAASYTFTASPDGHSGEPAVTITTAVNYVNIPISDKTVDIGTWNWSVTQTDFENTVSEPSPLYTFTIEPRKIPDRTLLYPPENYTVQDTLAAALSFSWKTSDAQTECTLEFAADESFAVPVIQKQISGSEASGIQPGAGTWYWRICAADAETGDMLYSPAHRLTVVPELGAPAVISPKEGETVVSHAKKPVEFSWQPIEGADHYIFRLYRQEDTAKQNAVPVPAAERNYLSETSIRLYLPAAYATDEPVSYVWSVQAAARETDIASARTGRSSEQAVSVRSPQPVMLSYPADNAKIKGVDALRSPVQFTWSSPEPAARSAFILRRMLPGGGMQTVLTRSDPVQPLSLERLGPGTYQWTVEAQTDDGADIKARTPRTFTISAPETLPQAVLLQPAAGAVFGPAYLHANRTFRFAWQKVAGATEYVFSLYRKTADGKRGSLVAQQTLPAGKTELTFTDISVLDAGSFIWNIDTNARAADGYLEQKGTPCEAEFTIDITMPDKITPELPGKLYGN